MEYNRDDLRLALATIPCHNRECGDTGHAVATIETTGPHFARIECGSCGYWIDWLSWPQEHPKTDRKRSRRQITKLGDDRCELCLRSRFEIPPPDILDVHHIIEVQDGGTDHPDNLRAYCTSCHRLVGWLRTHFGRYHLNDAA